MRMQDEILALREEVARLRERIAILEVQRPAQVVSSPSLTWPPLQTPDLTVGDAPGWWQNGPTA